MAAPFQYPETVLSPYYTGTNRHFLLGILIHPLDDPDLGYDEYRKIPAPLFAGKRRILNRWLPKVTEDTALSTIELIDEIDEVIRRFVDIVSTTPPPPALPPSLLAFRSLPLVSALNASMPHNIPP